MGGVILISLAVGSAAQAAIIAFDDLIAGQTSYSFDGDGDGSDDVIFSTIDPSGFNTIGPGLFQSYINEPGLEGTSLLNPDLRVDFLVGAKDFLKFGFALNSGSERPGTFASFQVFDSSNNLLASSNVPGLYSPSSFPEGLINVNFLGTASYALFNFSSDFGRYIIDNFEGTYGTTEVESVPEPASTLGILALGVLAAGSCFNRKLSQGKKSKQDN
ncbi:MAG: PEP-CTERM sorting domain-containing protein [Microcystis novacekii Mn_MB_F_20050700_S1]|uniref:PEP-CTERM sorting domain-containing protein n=1 Tax=Microcystis novacekii Mn_MB_F_20050700_S1D TaxID=2486266 RepID=A0A552IVJ6_9CHRO|nr:MAG: PEP-CTERM sorting domain-containing protein [Microcystis novacekii Mn_MB_F_20050700_S1]TRU87513.1 MAG: PEP-CTERM sorting domain-containing protein [Microcystis novacekii Mn_MB_F_20050700_S1D]